MPSLSAPESLAEGEAVATALAEAGAVVLHRDEHRAGRLSLTARQEFHRERICSMQCNISPQSPDRLQLGGRGTGRSVDMDPHACPCGNSGQGETMIAGRRRNDTAGALRL